MDSPSIDALIEIVSAVRRHCRSTGMAEDEAVLKVARVRPLVGGMNNAVFAADVGGHALCLKCYRVDDRQRAEREWQALSALHHSGCTIAPMPYRFDPDPEAPVVVMERLTGTALGGRTLGRGELSALVQAHRGLYSLTPEVLPSITWPVHSDARARLQRVRAEIGWLTSGSEEDTLMDSVTVWLSGPKTALLERPATSVFSRGDPNLANCLWDGRRVRIVDYEYGGWSDLAFDLADLVEHVQSRGTPDGDWLWFVQQFSLSRDEVDRFEAARRLLGLFWLTMLRPREGASIVDGERFKRQRQRVMHLMEE